MKKRIYLSPPHIGEKERLYVHEAFDTNWISPVGPNIDAFERELATIAGGSGAVALSSGTAAIHLALVMLGVSAGDEVICQSFTFSGSCNPILYQGATPVFIDSEEQTWNLDPALLEEAIVDRLKKGKRPKAIIVVDLYGMPARLSAIKTIADQYEIPVIEDAAEALGSSYLGKPCGTWGLFGIYSFNGNKIITTSGGGALISGHEAYLKKTKFLSTQARDPAPHYQHSEIGFNYRLSNVCAGIGRGQLAVLNERVTARRAIFDQYCEGLADCPVEFLAEPDGSFCNRWLTTLIFPNTRKPEAVRIALEAQNIESRPLWKPMHLQPVFAHAVSYSTGVSERLFNTGLCLPSGSALTPAEQYQIIDVIRQTLA